MKRPAVTNVEGLLDQDRNRSARGERTRRAWDRPCRGGSRPCELRNSCPPIWRLVAPVAASRTTCSSWGVSCANGSTLARRAATSPAARNSLCVRSVHGVASRRSKI
jgi:hypothetical protein